MGEKASINQRLVNDWLTNHIIFFSISLIINITDIWAAMAFFCAMCFAIQIIHKIDKIY